MWFRWREVKLCDGVTDMCALFAHVCSSVLPQSSSVIQQLRSWIAGAYPEFFDSKFVTRNEAREMTRVQRRGRVKVTINVMSR